LIFERLAKKLFFSYLVWREIKASGLFSLGLLSNLLFFLLLSVQRSNFAWAALFNGHYTNAPLSARAHLCPTFQLKLND